MRIDDEIVKLSRQDVAFTRQFKWSAIEMYGRMMIRRTGPRSASRRAVYLHIAIAGRMGLTGRIGFKNGDTLDCRRSNLRATNHSLAGASRRLGKNNTSGYKGVSFNKRDNAYHAYITVERDRVHLGSFSTPEKAAREYDEAARMFFGEHARLNMEAA